MKRRVQIVVALSSGSVESRSRNRTAEVQTQPEKLEALFNQTYPLVRRAAQVHSAVAIANGIITPADREDLEQEALTACWRALPHFNQNRASLKTFVEHVIANRARSFYRAQRCPPRDQRLDESNSPVCSFRLHAIHLRWDVQRILKRLSEPDRELALALMEHTPAQAAFLIRMARSTVYRRMTILRIQFSNAGLTPEPARQQRVAS